MLFKNDEIYKLAPADYKEIKAKYPKFPIRLVYPENRVRKSRLKHNTLPDKPNSISFPLVAMVKTKTGTERWRYAENSVIDANGRTIWTPKNLILRSSLVLQETDIELIYWLVNCCEFLDGGKNHNGKLAKCTIEDLVGAADRKVKKEEEKATLKAMLYSSKIGLPEPQIRQIAKAYFINDVEELTFAQVKLALEAQIMRDKINGITKFLEFVDAEQVLSIRANLQNAIDKEIITFVAAKKQWAWVTPQGQKNIPFADVSAANDPNEALYELYLADKKFAQEIVSTLKGNKVVMAEGADDPDGEV